jgi:hypothetical protein
MITLAPKSKSGRFTTAACSVLLCTFAAASFSAVLTKNATIDEPAHALAGWLDLRRGDFRFETVNPSLWKMYAAIGNVGSNPKMTFDGPVWRDVGWDPQAEVVWACRTLYQTPGNDADAFINRSRGMMLLLAVIAGAVLAAWTHRIGGPVAAVVATALFCVDPTVLAHAPLVKSDIAFALVLFGLAWATWSLGQKVTIGRVLLVGLLCGVELNVKFSGVIVGPILALMLAVRAVMPKPWDGSRFGRTVVGRLGIAALVGGIAIAMCVGVTWAAYGLRFGPAPSPTVRMNMDAVFLKDRQCVAAAELHRVPTPAEVANRPAGPTERVIAFANEHRLLPQAMLAGLLYQHASTQLWNGLLDGQIRDTGRWDYFPRAFVYKTPVAELAAVAVAGIILLFNVRRIPRHGWTFSCIAIPFAVFSAAAMTTHLNVGLRNILPLYPFLFLSIGVAAAIAWRERPRLTAVAGSLLAIGVVAADISAWPDFVPFFNAASSANELEHLADSNLDWGQDVRQLADWQKRHPDVPLYTYLFTTVDPKYYGVRATSLPASGGSPPGIVAISATHVQGIYLSNPAERQMIRRLTSQPPVGVVGRTIYLFRYPGQP